MKIQTQVLVLVPLLFAGCASMPPRMEGNRYIDEKYEFSMTVPDGWQQESCVPDWFRKRRPDKVVRLGGRDGRDQFVKDDLIEGTLNRHFRSLILSNRKAEAVIVVMPSKSVFDVSRMSMDALERSLKRGKEAEARVIKGADYLKDYRCKFSASPLMYKPKLWTKSQFKEDNARREITYLLRSYNYLYKDDDTGKVWIWLMSDSAVAGRNHEAFDAFCKTLARYRPSEAK